MTRRSTTVLIAIGILIAVADNVSAQEKDEGGGIAAIGQSFTYQGVLKQSGTALNGTCDLQFSLWNAASGPSQIGSTNQFLNQSVTNGLITQMLNFGAGAFDGNDRWIEIAVRAPAASGGYTTLTPRQKVNATPYALWALSSSGGGGLILPYSGTVNVSGAAFSIVNDGGVGISSAGEAYAVRGNHSSTGNFGILGHPEYGVYGVAVSAPDWGVRGLHDQTGNYGALGTASDGVFGQALGANGHGVYGYGDYGVWGESPNANGRGVVGVVSGAGDAVGVLGLHSPTGNYGRLGMSTAGVVGFATGNNWAGYFEGPVFATGGLSTDHSVVTNRVHADALTGLESFFTRTGDGLLITFGRSSQTEGSISVIGSTVSYNPFTGSHYAWTETGIERGALVSLTGVNRRSHDRPDAEIMYGIKPSDTSNDPRCMGAYLGLEASADHDDRIAPHLVMAIGNGDMWVSESNTGNIEPGDYLISSDVPGCAMKDDPKRFPVGYIVARAGEPVHWSEIESPADGSAKRKVISVFFESFVRDSRGAELASVVTERDGQIKEQQKQIAAFHQANQEIQDRLAALEAAVARLKGN